MSNVDISNYLNSGGTLSVRGQSYTPKLIWGLLKKYQNRLNRFKSDRVVYKSEEICIIPKKEFSQNQNKIDLILVVYM